MRGTTYAQRHIRMMERLISKIQNAGLSQVHRDETVAKDSTVHKFQKADKKKNRRYFNDGVSESLGKKNGAICQREFPTFVKIIYRKIYILIV